MLRIHRLSKPFLLMMVILISLLNGEAQAESAYEYLDRLALEANADKASSYHNYTKVYAKYFDAIKDQPLKFMEIGVYQGASVKLWEAYFPNADLHFIDIDLSRIPFKPARSHLHLADQANPNQLLAVMNETGGEFDVILDDGGHTMNQQITSFKTLFPYLKSGGVYIVEDLHTSYWRSYGGGGDPYQPRSSPQSAIEFLKQLIDDVNYVGARTTRANHDGNLDGIKPSLNIYREQILSITFYDSLCFITKR